MGGGGRAGTRKRALAAEAAVGGQPWSEGAMELAASALARDFQPIDDHRASADYRSRVAGNLFRRLYRDISGAPDPPAVVAP